MYDPWGKGYGGLPERKENGKIMRNRQHLNNKFKVICYVKISCEVKKLNDDDRSS